MRDFVHEFDFKSPQINYALGNFKPEFAKTNVKAMMIEDGFGVVNFVDMYAWMNKIVADSRI